LFLGRLPHSTRSTCWIEQETTTFSKKLLHESIQGFCGEEKQENE
jgi:hypothetical protein